ncbi:hypothetical protein GCWU000341_01209 [Oribacterium sp. oral taxon 078 str. F0262]|nr:hypothetical protein GCWU000341_01209 [Oribacterium sp. oral taxon 078 str. F0262]
MPSQRTAFIRRPSSLRRSGKEHLPLDCRFTDRGGSRPVKWGSAASLI